MQYRSDLRSGSELSILGFGCMRFPRGRGGIDEAKTEKLILSAVENGVNYFDTAYIYGGSEEMLGKILHKNGLRDKIYLATKLPLAKCRTPEDLDTLFATQLERLKTDRIDYYLMHNLSDLKLWQRLCGLGVEAWLAQKRREGAIGQVGFSFHGSQNEFMALLDAYDWDFCQIQYNYVNTNYQAGQAGLQAAAKKGLPVFIMEPLLGGRLANGLPQTAAQLLEGLDGDASPAAWALRWLWNQPEVTLVLSGMNEGAQLSDNLRAAQNARPGMLTPHQLEAFDKVVEAFNASYKIPCTGCNYCMPCPHKVNIPGCFAAYNLSFAAGRFTGMQAYMTSTGATDPEKNYAASQCVGCGACEKKCPQHIPIVSSLKTVRKKMEPFWFRPVVALFTRLRG